MRFPTRIRLFTVIVFSAVMIAVTLVVLNKYNTQITFLEDENQKTRLEQIALEQEKSTYQEELAIKDTDSYIIDKARTLYGYLMPGEIRFQVTNIDDLYEEPQATVIGVGE